MIYFGASEKANDVKDRSFNLEKNSRFIYRLAPTYVNFNTYTKGFLDKIIRQNNSTLNSPIQKINKKFKIKNEWHFLLTFELANPNT